MISNFFEIPFSWTQSFLAVNVYSKGNPRYGINERYHYNHHETSKPMLATTLIPGDQVSSAFGSEMGTESVFPVMTKTFCFWADNGIISCTHK